MAVLCYYIVCAPRRAHSPILPGQQRSYIRLKIETAGDIGQRQCMALHET
jgi:hypothetical protein